MRIFQYWPNFAIALTYILMLTLCTSCGGPPDIKPAQNEATSYLELVRDKEFDKAFMFYDPVFFRTTSRAEQLNYLKTANARLGEILSFAFASGSIQTNVQLPIPGTYYVLYYKVQYSRYPAVEKITLVLPASETQIKIVGHMISSEGFQESAPASTTPPR